MWYFVGTSAKVWTGADFVWGSVFFPNSGKKLTPKQNPSVHVRNRLHYRSANTGSTSSDAYRGVVTDDRTARVNDSHDRMPTPISAMETAR